MRTDIRTSGHYATYKSAEYRATINADGTVNLLSWNQQPPDGFRGSPHGGPWINTVPPTALSGLNRVHVLCRWREQPFTLTQVNDGDIAVLSYDGNDRRWAGMMALTEDPFGAWTAYVPLDEVEDIHQESTDVLSYALNSYARAGNSRD